MNREFRIAEVIHSDTSNICIRKWKLTIYDERHNLYLMMEFDTLADAVNFTDHLEWDKLPATFIVSI